LTTHSLCKNVSEPKKVEHSILNKAGTVVGAIIGPHPVKTILAPYPGH